MLKGLKDFFTNLAGAFSAEDRGPAMVEDVSQMSSEQLAARAILEWSWARVDGVRCAAPAVFVERFPANGLAPLSRLSTQDQKNLSPERRLLCKALDEIATGGGVLAQTGSTLRGLAETGRAVHQIERPPIQRPFVM